ncbi:hypothetical protein QJS10_CPB17g00398 [Acorus calamus]|uniref:DNA-3-methyladenine glycosylase I n=1 Tax=Acorus calamus TaxID=4465 RepID=A0AAV9CYV2_ACOCL|nr:hypothetical protein QJS10_CPB17g00398 [Acorus calamus]
MPTQSLRRHISERTLSLKDKDEKPSKAFLTKNLQKVVRSVGRRSDGGSVGEGKKGRLASKDDGVLKRCSWITKSSEKLFQDLMPILWPTWKKGKSWRIVKREYSTSGWVIGAGGEEYGSFSAYLWSYMNYKPIVNEYKNSNNIPLRTTRSESISKDLLRRGFRLVGPTIVHFFMQASGMTNDHLSHCFRSARRKEFQIELIRRDPFDTAPV